MTLWMEGLRTEAGYEKCSEKAFSDVTYTHGEWCWLCFDWAVGEVIGQWMRGIRSKNGKPAWRDRKMYSAGGIEEGSSAVAL